MVPRAIGLNRVRSTWGSRFRSHRSLIVQPAPRMMRAPAKNNVAVEMTSTGVETGEASGAARRVENRHGKYR
jgi:hypothetical protein